MGEKHQATVTLVSGLKFTGGASSGHMVDMDAAVDHGGENEGFQPIELLLVGLGGCTAMDVLSILRKSRQDVVGYEIRLNADRSDDHPRVYTSINIEHVFRGRSVDERAVERAINLSNEKYCSAMAMLRLSTPITTSYRLIEEGKEEVDD
jgi:putative redox protein